MMRVLAGLAAVAFALRAFAAPDPVFQAEFSNPSVSPSHWVLTLNPNGSGHFHSERGKAAALDPLVMDISDVNRDVRLSEEFAGRVFQEVQGHSVRAGDCESHMKVAFQGWKRFTYSGPEGKWSCEFNYSRDKQLQDLGDSLLAVAATILEGARLEMLLQHDRLGLDHEMEYVSDASSDGRLLQLCAIRGILERLADDQDVMERVRKRARVLLAKTEK